MEAESMSSSEDGVADLDSSNAVVAALEAIFDKRGTERTDSETSEFHSETRKSQWA